jgi:predicted transcriptional regulator
MTEEAKKSTSVASLKIEDIMTDRVHTLSPGDTIGDAIRMFLDKKIAGAPIVDSSGHVLSVISEVDLMMFAAKDGLKKTINEYLSKLVKPEKVISVNHRESFVQVFKQFLVNPVRRVLVLDSTGKLMGLVSRSNILAAFLKVKEEEEKQQASTDN